MEPKMPRSAFRSVPTQAKRIEERRNAKPVETVCCGLTISVEPGVYQTSTDSELMAASVHITSKQRFLEIGCGTGVVSLALAKRALQGVGTDINERAIENSRKNAETLGITNVKFLVSDVFENVEGTYDVIVCNPPYTNHETSDVIERMFWDPDNDMKREFFNEAHNHLSPGGRIYFGWANFADIDVELPFRLAAEKYTLAQVFSKPQKRNEFTYYVLEFKAKS